LAHSHSTISLSQALQSALATADCGGDEDFRVAYTPLAEHLGNPSFIEHASKDIRILVACCIADLFRLFAPDSPYGDPEQLKVRGHRSRRTYLQTALVFLVRQLRGLDNPKDANYNNYFYLLEVSEWWCAVCSYSLQNVNAVHTMHMACNLADPQPVLCQLLKHCFALLSQTQLHSDRDKLQRIS
jgi:sister-chromatid-cohesion protein PDS5